MSVGGNEKSSTRSIDKWIERAGKNWKKEKEKEKINQVNSREREREVQYAPAAMK